jgi:proline iminopeptidase
LIIGIWLLIINACCVISMKQISFIVLMFTALLGHAQDFSAIKNINGTKLFISAAGSGEPIVVLHGGPGLNHSYFKPHLSGLEKNFRMIYYDQRACGQSAIPPADSISIQFLVDDLEGIRKEFKIEKLNLLAHSWGAILATHYALKYPNNVRRIIFSNPAFFSREYDREAGELTKKKTTKEDSIQRASVTAAGMNMTSTQVEQLFKISFRASAYDRKNIDKLNLNIPENFQKANRNLFGGLMKDPEMKKNLYASLSLLKFPVLVIHGEADILPIASIHRLKNSLPKGELVILSECGHFPFIENEQENYLLVVRIFME